MNRSFRPGPEHGRAFRHALGCFATGVTIVTCRDEGGPISLTANSFASVSLDPPLVLWSPAVASARHDAFVSARHFSIHVLSTAQLDLAQHCAGRGGDLEGPEWEIGPEGVPVLRNCLARFDCRHHAAYGAGDHTIVIGLVETVTRGDGEPLLFSRGAYGSFLDGIVPQK